MGIHIIRFIFVFLVPVNRVSFNFLCPDNLFALALNLSYLTYSDFLFGQNSDFFIWANICLFQLAILASYSGDELVAVYRYFRSLAVDNPFSTARDNLIVAFEKV